MNETEGYLTSTDGNQIPRYDTAQAQALLRTFLTSNFHCSMCPSGGIRDKEGGFRFQKLLLRNFVVQISVYFGTEEFLFVFGVSFSNLEQFYLY